MEPLKITAADAGMPITGVTLYDNGYAVFQRETVVQGHGHVDLYFPSEHIQNVLQSLQFLGEAGKNVGNIAYEAKRPTCSINIQGQSPLLGLLRSLAGVRISLEKENDERVEGRILGTDDLVVGDVKMKHLSVLQEEGLMRTLSIQEIVNFRILDSQVQQDVSFSLDLLRNSSKQNMQKLSVFYANVASPGKLIVRYGFKVNEWKSSYRMQLSDHPTKMHLNGLAVVENVLDEDWTDVSLTLVVGAPALDTASQDTVDIGQWELTIKALDGSFVKIRANPKDPILTIKNKVAKKKGMNPTSFRLIFAGKTIEDGRVLSDYSISNSSVLHMTKTDGPEEGRDVTSSQTQFVMAAQENLSYYPIPMRVTAQRKQKAIVPLLETELEGQKVVLYDETIRKGNPLLAILFENITGRTLEGGSLEILTSDVCLGQGTMPTLHPGDESPPIPFAVELGCEIAKQFETLYFQPHLVSISNGIVSIYRSHHERTTYKIMNKTEKELDFLLNHLFLEKYDLVQNFVVEEEAPVDITDRFYQFRFKVNPRDEKKCFTVCEETIDHKEYPIQDVKHDAFEAWVRKKMIGKQPEKEIREILVKIKKINTIQRGILEKETEIREVNLTQERLRENILALEHHEREAVKYIHSLATEEDKLKALQESIKQDRMKKMALDKEMKLAVDKILYKQEFPRGVTE